MNNTILNICFSKRGKFCKIIKFGGIDTKTRKCVLKLMANQKFHKQIQTGQILNSKTIKKTYSVKLSVWHVIKTSQTACIH